MSGPAAGGTWVTFAPDDEDVDVPGAFIGRPSCRHRAGQTWTACRCGCLRARSGGPGRLRSSRWGAHALRFLADYFAIPYPAEKLDLIAIPDFAAGAMENLGCITFRETALLVDRERSSRTELERVANVVSHEIAHMWFGDLVTMTWWNGIWLNEAFGHIHGAAHRRRLPPIVGQLDGFQRRARRGDGHDELASTRPIEYEVISPDDCPRACSMGSPTTKAQPSCACSSSTWGPSDSGTHPLYLDRHRLGNTETTDLWTPSRRPTGEPVRAIMDFLDLPGRHPVVTVGRSNDARAVTRGAATFPGAVPLPPEPR